MVGRWRGGRGEREEEGGRERRATGAAREGRGGGAGSPTVTPVLQAGCVPPHVEGDFGRCKCVVQIIGWECECG